MDPMKIAWLTDIHLNFLKPEARKKFYQRISDTAAEAILITGDIAEAQNVCQILSEFSQHTNQPIYFVLGNHDYYNGSVESVRKNIRELCTQNEKLIWLGLPALIPLQKSTLLIGQDGWADARYGDFDHSVLTLNDSRFIVELFQAFLVNKSALKHEMQKLADADAKMLECTLLLALQSHPEKIIIATHVPPFPECSWHKDKLSDANWLPYFTSKATGYVLSTLAKKYPKTHFLVLCGHTHSSAHFKPIQNLEIKAGSAAYHQPKLQEIIMI